MIHKWSKLLLAAMNRTPDTVVQGSENVREKHNCRAKQQRLPADDAGNIVRHADMARTTCDGNVHPPELQLRNFAKFQRRFFNRHDRIRRHAAVE